MRHAITRLIHYTRRHRITAIAVEDLDFADARSTGRETMGRGRRGKRFRNTVAGLPTAVFCNRLSAQAHRHGIRLYAVNPAYSSAWGDQHWRAPYKERHPTPGSRHSDRQTRPRLYGAATERCDTHATRGSCRESYPPGRTRTPEGDQ